MNTLQRKNTLSANKEAERQHQSPQKGILPEFLLSAASPCEVKLVADAVQQTPPSKTMAELLADGQCEV